MPTRDCHRVVRLEAAVYGALTYYVSGRAYESARTLSCSEKVVNDPVS
ncbi:MAG: hypothetical protein GX141_07675 [Armatimonadetes bacterium]|nr:hypothetical protein [Armatimonadota bacterium]